MVDEDIKKLEQYGVILDNLRKEWDITKQLSYPDMKTLWDTAAAMREDYDSWLTWYSDYRLDYD